MIHDEVTSKDYVISQISIGIGKSFALITQFEKVILEAMENIFQLHNLQFFLTQV